VHIEAHATAASYIPVVGLLAGGAVSHSNTVTFDIDRNGVLTDKAGTTANGDVRTGLANQK
jgi:hypothetical protein